MSVETIQSLGEGAEALEQPEQPEQQPITINFGWLLKETGTGEVEEYQDHVLNFDKSPETARIIRGVSGFVGRQLNLAIIDIFIGVLSLFRRRSKNERTA